MLNDLYNLLGIGGTARREPSCIWYAAFERVSGIFDTDLWKRIFSRKSENIRQFYKVNSIDQIGETVFSQFENLPVVGTGRKFFLSWSHYLKLMRIDNLDERNFCKNCQGGKVLEVGKFAFDTANSANVQILEKIEAWGYIFSRIFNPASPSASCLRPGNGEKYNPLYFGG